MIYTMNLNYKQSQFELFPGAAGSSDRANRPQFFFSSLSFSLENAIIAGIFVLMAVVFSFSVGVERGKKIALVNPLKNVYSSAVVAPREGAGPVPAGKTAVNKAATSTTMPEEKKATPPQAAPAQPEEIELSYTVQVASFKKVEYAQQEAELLRKKGYEIFVLPKGNYSIVCVGKFTHQDQANVTLTKLRKTYKDSMLRRL